MNHDITFCTVVDCPMRFTCKRHVNNNTFDKGELISMCNFEHGINGCEYFKKEEV